MKSEFNLKEIRTVSENLIQKSINNLVGKQTMILIAHRLSTIMKADKIVVMKQGKILQMGTHEDLIKKQGQYRNLWNLQKGGYIK